eukprot:3549339-Pleurochrysis_carterae.AAC.6
MRCHQHHNKYLVIQDETDKYRVALAVVAGSVTTAHAPYVVVPHRRAGQPRSARLRLPLRWHGALDAVTPS